MGLYTHTTRADGTVLTGGGSVSDIFNVDHVNHVTHTAAPFINSFEATVGQMQLETDPAPLGVVSLSAALSDELRRLRFALTQTKQNLTTTVGAMPGVSHWYTPTSLTLIDKVAAARIEASVAQGIVSGAGLTTLQFQSILYDTPSMVITASGNQVGFTVPLTGIYNVGGSVGVGDLASTGASGTLQLAITQDTDTLVIDEFNTAAHNVPKILTVETVAKLTAGQVMRLKLAQVSGSTITLAVSPLRPAFWLTLLGRDV